MDNFRSIKRAFCGSNIPPELEELMAWLDWGKNCAWKSCALMTAIVERRGWFARVVRGREARERV